MKHTVTLTLVFIFSILILTAQNPLFLEFGQSKEEVRAALRQLDYLQDMQEDLSQNIIIVAFDNKRFEYTFQNDVLYEIKATNFYERTRNARKAVQGSLEYFELVQGKMLRPEIPLHAGYYVSLQESRVLELGVREAEKGMVISLHAISRYHGPRSTTENYVFSLMAGAN